MHREKERESYLRWNVAKRNGGIIFRRLNTTSPMTQFQLTDNNKQYESSINFFVALIMPIIATPTTVKINELIITLPQLNAIPTLQSSSYHNPFTEFIQNDKTQTLESQ